jgi:transcriptional regulator with XRE-family HTH domain
MFWERFLEECTLMGKKPNPVGKELGVSSGTITGWKNGALPKPEILSRIASYFDVSVDYLIGKTDKKEKLTTETDDGLSPEFKSLYRQLTPEQKSIVLGAMREFVKEK